MPVRPREPQRDPRTEQEQVDEHQSDRLPPCAQPAEQARRYPGALVGVGRRMSPGDPDLALDLQALFNRCYDEGAYARRIDYAREPAPALADEDAQWADALLRAHRVRH